MPSLPRLDHKDLRIVQWGDRLISRLVSGALAALRLSNVLYVDIAGNDTTAQRGNIDKPYLTVQAALDAAAVSGDVIQVGPGLFEAPTINWPAKSLTLRGAGPMFTALDESTSTGSAISVVPGAAESIGGIVIEDIRLSNADGAAYTLNIDGSASPTSLVTVFLEDVWLSNSSGAAAPALRIASANKIWLDKVDADTDSILLEEVHEGRVTDLRANEYTIDYDPAGTHVAGQRSVIAHTGSIVTGLTVNGCAWVAFGSECAAVDVLCNLTDDATDNDFGFIDFRGRCQTVAVTFDYQVSTHTGVIFDSADIGTTFSVADVGTTVERCFAKARQAVFRSTTDDDIVAGLFCDLDVREAFFNQESLHVPVGADNGTIDRSVWLQNVAAGVGLPLVMAFADAAGNTVPYPVATNIGGGLDAGGAYLYSVAFESDSAGDFPMHVTNPKSGSKLPSGVSVEWDGALANLGGPTMVTITRPSDRLS